MPLGSIFTQLTHFMKKLSTLKTSGEKVFFFSKFEITQWNGTVTKKWIKKVFKLVSVKSVKTACVSIIFFFHYFKYYGHFIAKIERKESTLYLKHEIILYEKEKRSK